MAAPCVAPGARGLASRSLLGSRAGLEARARPCGPPPRPAPVAPVAEVRLRFTKLGRNKAPFFRVIAIDSKCRRDGRPLEYLGWYNPQKHETQLDAPNIRKWLDTGAQPSESVNNLLLKALIVKRPEGQPKRVYAQLSTKAAKEAKAAKAAKLKAIADAKKKAKIEADKAAAAAAKAAAAAAKV